MTSRTLTIQTTNRFILRKRTRKSNSKTYYELSLNYWDYTWSIEECERVRDIVDPTRNRAGRAGCSWKFQNRTAAEQALTLLLIQL